MAQPGAAEQVVVSMLDQLGIGLYRTDGAPIRAGLERSDADLFLWEPEARGLINLFNAQFTEDGWIEFRDFHAVLADYGYAGSAEELAAAYADSFAAAPDEPMSQFVGYVDVDVPITKFAAWLLFVDGFVAPSSEATGHAVLSRGAPGRAALARTSGTSARAVAQVGGGLTLDPTLMAHLILIAASARPSITVNPAKVHEGHGATGAPAELKVQVNAVAVTYVSPFTGASLIPARAVTTDGVGVTFEPSRSMTKHGSLSATNATTDAAGQATVTYTPRSEPAGGLGVLVSTAGIVTATASLTDVMTQLYGQPALAAFAPANVTNFGQLQIEWHDEPPLRIDFTNTYSLELPFEVMGTAQTGGQDTISGDLIVDEDDPTRWEGTAIANATGTFSGELMGHSCSSSWAAQQILQVTGLEDPGSGEMLFVFQPLTDPIGSTGSPKCSPGLKPPTPDGLYWIPFNDIAVTDPSIGLRFNVAIPRPGFFETDYPVPLQGTGVTGYADWLVRIEFVTP